ncbi:MAG: putative 2-hydroxyglutaryl-CoA dehydratase D-component [Promethearchaeota archaeon]|nr:MAG: putative 2-hydroxyglutaryl-CoA dehydratase D-component [Candidatus Lokiarchaeota archaeon]
MKKIGIIDTCVDTPEELILAAGFIPYRLFGDPTITHEHADEHVPATHCVWSRNVLEQGLKGLDNDIVGMVSVHGCDCTNRQFDIWLDCVDLDFMHFLNCPLKRTKIAREFYIDDMKEFINHMENYFNIEITEEKIWENIRLTNKIRTILRDISEYRSKMVLKGSEFHKLIKDVMTQDRNEALEVLKNALEKLKSKEPFPNKHLKKVLVTGSLIDDTSFLEHMEESGYQIVVDDLCLGTHYFWTEIDESHEDPLQALADYHFNKPLYSTKIPSHSRYEFIEELSKKYQVDGVINIAQKFCETILYDHPYMNRQFKEKGMPYLFIEKEYNTEAYKQLKTRFEAFAEII